MIQEILDTQKLQKVSLLLIITALLTVIGNMLGAGASLVNSLQGIAVIYVVAMIGVILSMLPYLKKLSVVFWVCTFAVIASAPFFPGAAWISGMAAKVSFVPMGPPTLAYAGLALGKDIPMFKKLSWKIIPVALLVFTGTFVLGTIVAEFGLRIEGII